MCCSVHEIILPTDIKLFDIYGILLLHHCRSEKARIDQSDALNLENIRHSLIRQEDTIIYGLLERAQYCYNRDAYDPNVFCMEGFNGSLVEYMLRETERLHAKVEIKLLEPFFLCFFFKTF